MKVSDFRAMISDVIGGLDDDDQINTSLSCDRDGYVVLVTNQAGELIGEIDIDEVDE